MNKIKRYCAKCGKEVLDKDRTKTGRWICPCGNDTIKPTAKEKAIFDNCNRAVSSLFR